MFKRVLALVVVVSLLGALPVLAQEDDPSAKAIAYLADGTK